MKKVVEQFRIIAEKRSISRASEELGISQPALSKNIKAYEEELGVQLLRRESRGISLTEAGEKLYAHVNRMHLEYELALKDIERIKNNEKVLLRIAAGPIWINKLPQIVSKVLERHPRTNFQLYSASAEEIIPKLSSDDLEIGFGGNGFNNLETQGLVFVPLKQVKMAIAVHRSHPLAKKYSIDELVNYPWVAYQKSEQSLIHLNNFLDRNGKQRVTYFLETEFLDTALHIMRENLAVICIVDLLYPQLPEGEYTLLDIGDELRIYQTGIWYSSRSIDNPIIKSIVSICIKDHMTL